MRHIPQKNSSIWKIFLIKIIRSSFYWILGQINFFTQFRTQSKKKKMRNIIIYDECFDHISFPSLKRIKLKIQCAWNGNSIRMCVCVCLCIHVQSMNIRYIWKYSRHHTEFIIFFCEYFFCFFFFSFFNPYDVVQQMKKIDTFDGDHSQFIQFHPHT